MQKMFSERGFTSHLNLFLRFFGRVEGRTDRVREREVCVGRQLMAMIPLGRGRTPERLCETTANPARGYLYASAHSKARRLMPVQTARLVNRDRESGAAGYKIPRLIP